MTTLGAYNKLPEALKPRFAGWRPPPLPKVHNSPHRNWHWLPSVRTWVWFLFLVMAELVGTKMAQRMLEDHKSWDDSLLNAVLTKAGNHSSFMVLGSLLSVVWYATALSCSRLRGEFRLTRLDKLLAIMIAMCFWKLYIRQVSNAPDPGTFFAVEYLFDVKYTHGGWLYCCQAVEGAVNLGVAAVAAVWAVVAWKLAGTIELSPESKPLSPESKPWPDRAMAACLIVGPLMPLILFAGFTRFAGSAWISRGWSHGNLWESLLGYTIAMFLPNVIVLARAFGRSLPRMIWMLLPAEWLKMLEGLTGGTGE